MINIQWKSAVVALCVLVTPIVVAEPLYVTDKVTVGLYDDSTLKGGARQRLMSGAKVEILETVEDVVRVRDASGLEGWLRSTLLTSDRPKAMQLRDVSAELKKVTADLAKAQENIRALEPQAKAGKDAAWMKAELNKARKKAESQEVVLKALKAEQAAAEAKAASEEDEDVIGQRDAQISDLRNRLAASEMIIAEQQASSPVAFNLDERVWWLLYAGCVLLALGLGAGGTYYVLDRRLRRRFGGIKFH